MVVSNTFTIYGNTIINTLDVNVTSMIFIVVDIILLGKNL
jgi:hypothetical protein